MYQEPGKLPRYLKFLAAGARTSTRMRMQIHRSEAWAWHRMQELDDGRLSLRQINAIRLEDADEDSKAAEITMLASGTTLYASNRGAKDSSNTAWPLL